MECKRENCAVRKQISQETAKSFEKGQEPKGYCPQCPYCAGNCKKRRI